MGFSNFAVGMGNVALGMEDMAGKMQDRQLRAQYAEQMAGQVRRQQQEEADNQQMAEMNRQMLQRMQALNQRYTSSPDVQQHGAPAVPQGQGAAPTVRGFDGDGYAQDIAREGRGVVNPDSARYMEERGMLQRLRASEQARLDDIARKAPKGDVNRSTAKIVAEGKQRVAGYDQGIANYDQAINGTYTPDRVVPQGRGQKVSLGRSEQDVADNTATEASLQGSNVFELQKEIARTKDPKVRAVLEQELANTQRGGLVAAAPASQVAPQRGAPQAQPQASAPQQQTIQGQYNTVAGTNYDPQAEQRQYMQQYLTNVINVSRNPQIQQQAMQQLMGLKLQDANAQIDRVGRAADAGNPQALQQLLSMYAGEGNRLGVAQTNDGKVAVVNAQGQILDVFPDTRALSRALVTKLNTSLYESSVAMNTKIAEKFGLSQAEAAGKAPFEQALEATKGNAALQKQLIESDGQVRKELVHQILQGQQVGRLQSDGMGGVWGVTNNGQQTIYMGAPTVTNGVTSQPQVRQMPGLQVPAGRG